ncbi:MAG: DUF4349 domain-containing protein [Phycisphaerae bacterium]|nr:DUF4349 domain-containing protein [Phycisphaerae bacterium]
MTTPHLSSHQEAALHDLTAPRAPDRPAWRVALAETRRRAPGSFLSRPIARPWMAAAAAVALVAILAVSLAPSLRSARVHGGGERVAARSVAPSTAASGSEGFGTGLGALAAPTPDQPESVGPRRIARRASVDLVAEDVGATFSKAALLVTEALGEFVESASLSGPEGALQGTLLLRVQQQRLDGVLARLRQLGAVAAESAEGIDVTDRMIDLDATIRNEQRVERELLELLTARKDADLADILLLRKSLDEVRLRIERLQAQREQVSRSVELASVLVNIRAGDAPDGAKDGLGAFFASQLGKAWEQGARTLASTAAAIVRGFIGWLPGWIVVFTAVAILWRYARWLTARPVHEPTPRI